MRVTIESTERFFEASGPHRVRLWRGTSDSGAPVLALVAAVADTSEPPNDHLEQRPELHPIPPPVTGWDPAIRQAMGEIWRDAERLSADEARQLAGKARAMAAYRDNTWPEKACERCEKPYKGPAIYCSLHCAELDWEVALDVLRRPDPTLDATVLTVMSHQPQGEPVELRPGFGAIADGWLLVDDFNDLTRRIEALATWTKENGPLTQDEERTIRLMIERQIELGPDLLSTPAF